jgi:recombination protein RecR
MYQQKAKAVSTKINVDKLNKFLPSEVGSLVMSFGLFDGFGVKSATKMSLDFLRLSKEDQLAFMTSLVEASKNLDFCPICYSISQKHQICKICANSNRQQTPILQILVLEKATDVINFEEAGFYNGQYHVLGSLLDPLNNIPVANTTIHDLELRIDDWHRNPTEGQKQVELIFYFKKSFESNTTLAYIKDLFSKKKYFSNLIFTELANGLPITYNPSSIDNETLKFSFQNRR